MLLQKIEFWLFSVPALVVAICGIAYSRATSGLWARGAGSAARWAAGAQEYAPTEGCRRRRSL